CLQSRNSPWTF
nr:immunoglobulin light chain junction region [Macaca mulatta]MOV64513.1 immunoglobulin light chain junction region [Macaca mulatta]MOV65056.1 immunoglobulin light chain junction region [Macaca mulatta]